MDRPDPVLPAPGGSSSGNPAPAHAPSAPPAAAGGGGGGTPGPVTVPAIQPAPALVAAPSSPDALPPPRQQPDFEAEHAPAEHSPVHLAPQPAFDTMSTPTQQYYEPGLGTASASAPAQQIIEPGVNTVPRPVQYSSEPFIHSVRRPTTGSTAVGPAPTNIHQMSNPPTPPHPVRPPLPQHQSTRAAAGRSASVVNVASSMEKLEDADTLSGLGIPELQRDSAVRTNQPLPPLPQARLVDSIMPRRQRTLDGQGPGSATGRRSGIDWIVPVDDKPMRKRTVGERIQPTLDIAITERDKYAAKAKATGFALNAAIGLQVVLGSLTTGLSAVATTGRQTAIQTTILGGLATVVASYLARARGSNEPELSITRVKDLEHFIREAQAFQLDRGHVDTNEWDGELDRFRQQFEELLGNASGERKLAPPA